MPGSLTNAPPARLDHSDAKKQDSKYEFSEMSPHEVDDALMQEAHQRALRKTQSDSNLKNEPGSTNNAGHVYFRRPPRVSGERKDFHQKMFKTPKEAMEALLGAAQKKVMIPIDKLLVLGFFSGVFISFGGIFSHSVTLGIPHAEPGIQRLLIGITFPIALALIIFFGGELFTGNTMFMILGMLHKKVSWRGLLQSWVCSYFTNFAGAVFGAYFFGYLTDLFATDPWLSAVKAVAVRKCGLDFHVAFLRGVAANWLVNLAIYVGVVAEDVSGKFVSMFMIIATFAVSGFEHSIANMFFIVQGLLYGAETTFGEFLYKNLIPVTLGNILGGAIMAVGLWYLYSVKSNITKPGPELYTVTCLL